MPVPDLPRQFHSAHPVIKQRTECVPTQLSATLYHALNTLPVPSADRLSKLNNQEMWSASVHTWQTRQSSNLDDCNDGLVSIDTAAPSGNVSRTMAFVTSRTIARPTKYAQSRNGQPEGRALAANPTVPHYSHQRRTSQFFDVPKLQESARPVSPMIAADISPFVTALRPNIPAEQPHKKASQAEAQAPGPEPCVFNAASNKAYRKLVEPLSDWIAQFAWNVCISEGVHSRRPSVDNIFPHRQPSPPPNLAVYTRSILLSTLLTPSAILLSLYYVTRLPAVFQSADTLTAQELTFRTELLHLVSSDSSVKEMSETIAVFRLIVLGFMLANKWLDDHTFSNKTWHTVSNIPIVSLNRLETLALEILNHDLSIAPATWIQWLQQLRIYHATRKPNPPPIGRPSSDPHSLIRLAIDDLIDPSEIQAPGPVFLGLEQRILAAQERHDTDSRSLEIDLDEDGPLRDEYVPRRRSGTTVSAQKVHRFVPETLPPPAKWSPGADPPLLEKPRFRYEALQPEQPLALATCNTFYPPRAPHVSQAAVMHAPPGLSLNAASAYSSWPPLPAQVTLVSSVADFIRPQWLLV